MFCRLRRILKERGVRLAMDDFGTGYSSMSLIKRFPLDTLKIDRAFIRDLPDNNDDTAIANAIIGLGKALGSLPKASRPADSRHFYATTPAMKCKGICLAILCLRIKFRLSCISLERMRQIFSPLIQTLPGRSTMSEAIGIDSHCFAART